MRHAVFGFDFVSPLCYYSPISKRKDTKMKKCEICKVDRQYTREVAFGIICTGCYLEYYAS